MNLIIRDKVQDWILRRRILGDSNILLLYYTNYSKMSGVTQRNDEFHSTITVTANRYQASHVHRRILLRSINEL